MLRQSFKPVVAILVVSVALVWFASKRATASAPAVAAFPSPSLDALRGTEPSEATAVFAGGCFWGIEAVFEHLNGVKSAVSGYAGGSLESASYDQVSSGTTGHAESVRVVYDPSVISYGQLLKVFFAVAHDATQLNRQGPDVGPQYRSAIFYVTEEQKEIAQAYIQQLTKAKIFSRPIVTEMAALDKFYVAEEYHQDYLVRHPNQPYIVINDAPKLKHLQEQFPELYRK
ncbi:MAG: peptide-methionine (S)-S-oxide reductase MsrA [Gemmatimonadaceae bacterium]